MALNYFIVRRVHGSAWDRTRPLREQQHWDEHAAFMDRLVEEGFIVLGGPLGDGSLLIVDAGSAGEVEARLADDPWEPSGHLFTASIEPWEVLLAAPR